MVNIDIGERADTAGTLRLPGRIGLNAVFLEPRMGGVETYVRSLVPELVRLAPEVSFSLYCSPGGLEYLREETWAAGVELISHPLIGRPGLKALTELTVLGVVAGRKVDLLHSVAMTAPLRTSAVNVVTLHDLIWITAPDPGESGTTRLWRAIVPPVARRADRIITVSHASAVEIVQRLGVPAERIDVIPNAAGVGAGAEASDPRELRGRLKLGDGPVVLTVSAKKVHKNLARLTRAMVPVLARWPAAKLVMPGNPTPHEGELRALAGELGIGDSVVFPEYVSPADLEALYGIASCFVFASLHEGFGIPVLEAMRRGLPVACARASALPEVAGEAARYFDPYSVSDIAEAISDLLGDPALAAGLAEAGRTREAQFSWEKAALETLETYARAWSTRRSSAQISADAA